MSGIASAIEKMQSLSPERAERVISLIEDLAELEAREEAEDAAGAVEALARIEAGQQPVPWHTLKAELDASHSQS